MYCASVGISRPWLAKADRRALVAGVGGGNEPGELPPPGFGLDVKIFDKQKEPAKRLKM